MLYNLNVSAYRLRFEDLNDAMRFKADFLDDAMREGLEALFSRGVVNTGSRGTFRELLGVTIEVENPRARISSTQIRGKLYSQLGEVLWYLSGSASSDQIIYYLPKYVHEQDPDGTIYGAYGPRLKKDPLLGDNITNLIIYLKKNKGTKRAVLTLFHPKDIFTSHRHKDVPCTIGLQLIERDSKLNAITYMRSNDAMWGTLHDVFSFSFIQEYVACCLGLDVGRYYHHIGSYHLYDDIEDDAKLYLSEGYQESHCMPEMPKTDVENQLKHLIDFEVLARSGKADTSTSFSDVYWEDLANILRMFNAKRGKCKERKEEYYKMLSSSVYKDVLRV